VAVLQRHPLEPPIEMISPAVITAGEFGSIAPLGGHHERAAVGTLIMDNVNPSVSVADQHDRLAPDPGGEIVAGVFHLALVPDIDPGGAEYSFKLEFENGGIGIDLPMHPAWLHETGKSLCHQCYILARTCIASTRGQSASTLAT